jgi:hypothetical protein
VNTAFEVFGEAHEPQGHAALLHGGGSTQKVPSAQQLDLGRSQRLQLEFVIGPPGRPTCHPGLYQPVIPLPLNPNAVWTVYGAFPGCH